MTEDNISWTSFCQAMNSIAFWLIQNKKKYKKRDYYQILTLKESQEIRFRQAGCNVYNGFD